jgi:protein Tex
MKLIVNTIAQELNISQQQVTQAINLLDDGATVPFIARYRKEATNGLDDQQLRSLVLRLEYLRELYARKETILKTLREQEQLSPELEQAINNATTKVRLEDLYLPYRAKRRTRAYLAQQAGLEPLADLLLNDTTLDPIKQAQLYINPEAEIHDAELALQGAEQILMERFADHPDILETGRNYVWENGKIQAKELKGQSKQAYKYADYFNYVEAIKKIPSHRALALLRGRRERALQLKFVLPEACITLAKQNIATYFNIKPSDSSCHTWLINIIDQAWNTKLLPKLETEALSRLRELADLEAIKIFTNNLRDLLLSAPAGAHVVLGLDPGIRTGVKATVIDQTGQLLDYTIVFPLAPQYEWHESITDLAKLAAKYNVKLISIGNGTGSRETERLVKDLIKMYPDLELQQVLVNEAGASVYSASELACSELPELDVSLRGAVSIARRLQDPLAELVKIEPKAIGVGQYQHDVNQAHLTRSLNDVVEYCVNTVGVDVNLASEALLTHISGLNAALAKNIVEYRNINGAFTNREQLKLVARMGDKTYQQAIGFLRITNGDNPLDASGIHPESYYIAEQILNDRKTSTKINLEKYIDAQHGLETIQEIIQELDKPNRDPRPVFKASCFKEGIEEISHLKVGMILHGIVSNITNFGIFVDLGVHQYGLVHISEITNKFIRDPMLVTKVGEIIKVRVLSIDLPRRRISLSMKLEPEIKATKPVEKIKAPKAQQSSPKKNVIFNTSMADALSKLKQDLGS